MTEFEFLISSRTHLCRWLLRIPQTHETRACKEVCEKVAIATGGRRREADASRPSGFSRRLHKTECRRLLHCRDAAFVGSDSRAPDDGTRPHPAGVFFPKAYKKKNAADYYIAVMPRLLEAIRGRPLSIIR